MRHSLWIISLLLSLTACTTFQPSDNGPNHQGLCKEIKKRIIFNGATGNNTKATQQRAELGQLNTNYTNQDC